MFKFRDTNITSEDNSTKLSDLQLKWGPFLSMAAMIPNVSILLVNCFLQNPKFMNYELNIFTFFQVNAIFGHRFSIKPLLITSMVIFQNCFEKISILIYI